MIVYITNINDNFNTVNFNYNNTSHTNILV